MSRIGKKIIILPEKVSATIEANKIKLVGPKGELSHFIHPDVTVKQENNQLYISVKDENDKFNRSLWGTFAAIINNMLKGVTEGFSKTLEINGVGFTWEAQPGKVVLKVGFSHPVEYLLPKTIEAKAVKNKLTISGCDKQLVGNVAAEIRAIKKPEPYKGKGIKYVDEIVRRKAGKQAASASA